MEPKGSMVHSQMLYNNLESEQTRLVYYNDTVSIWNISIVLDMHKMEDKFTYGNNKELTCSLEKWLCTDNLKTVLFCYVDKPIYAWEFCVIKLRLSTIVI